MALYSDLNLNFIKHPNTRDVIQRYDVDAVRTSVMNLIKTNRGEKKFKPNFGGDLRAMLFEPNTLQDSNLLKRRWNEMFKMYEPRATIDRLDVTAENNELYIILHCIITGRPEITFTVPLDVKRVR